MAAILSTLSSFFSARHGLCRKTACALALTAAAPLPLAANVFDKDDRRPLTAEDGFAAVGQIVCDGSSRRPIGTLIQHPRLPENRDYDLVVTVAHAFRGRHNSMEARCAFLPGGLDSEARDVVHIALGTLEPGKAWHHDWAVAAIAGTPSTEFGALPLRTLTPQDLAPVTRAGGRYVLIGKNGERPRMMISERCGPVPKRHWHHGYFSPGEFNHDCDMIPGWSGGPLVLLLGGERHIVALNTTELNGIVHKVGDPWHPRMFPNTAIRFDGAFRDAVARLATGSWQQREDDAPATRITAASADGLAFSVIPESCPDESGADALAVLSAEITLVPAAQARAIC